MFGACPFFLFSSRKGQIIHNQKANTPRPPKEEKTKLARPHKFKNVAWQRFTHLLAHLLTQLKGGTARKAHGHQLELDF